MKIEIVRVERKLRWRTRWLYLRMRVAWWRERRRTRHIREIERQAWADIERFMLLGEEEK